MASVTDANVDTLFQQINLLFLNPLEPDFVRQVCSGDRDELPDPSEINIVGFHWPLLKRAIIALCNDPTIHGSPAQLSAVRRIREALVEYSRFVSEYELAELFHAFGKPLEVPEVGETESSVSDFSDLAMSDDSSLEELEFPPQMQAAAAGTGISDQAIESAHSAPSGFRQWFAQVDWTDPDKVRIEAERPTGVAATMFLGQCGSHRPMTVESVDDEASNKLSDHVTDSQRERNEKKLEKIRKRNKKPALKALRYVLRQKEKATPQMLIEAIHNYGISHSAKIKIKYVRKVRHQLKRNASEAHKKIIDDEFKVLIGKKEPKVSVGKKEPKVSAFLLKELVEKLSGRKPA